ncbi:MAG: RnfABCDGE type electron transport complex subunit D [Deltaproteobacteria bacterium]|nr:RnfABCDGE type electron transport complex subunit D [Deltaproteobacteria bacterium]
MHSEQDHLILHASPFVRTPVTTGRIMRDVILALIPVLGAAIYNFGLSAIMEVMVATIGVVGAEVMFTTRRPRTASLGDGSALLTGIILGLTLPPGLPLWMALVGGLVAGGVGKMVFGGLGHNLFNPALVGRAFLQAAFPTAMTTWAPPDGSWAARPEALSVPMLHGVDAVTAATPLARMKFEHVAAPTLDLFTGQTPGSLGETSALIIALAAIYLIARRAMDWRIPASILLTVVVFSGALYLINPEVHPTPWFMLMSGGLLFGSVFMATDPVTSPTAPKATWLFGVGVGVVVVLVRRWGGLPEGVMYAILLMNGATPLLERFFQPRPFGRGGPV